MVTTLYFDEDNFMSWIYHNDMNYVKNVFDYNLKSDIDKNKKKIMEDIIENNRNDINEIIKDKKMYDVKYFDDSLKNGILLKDYLLSKSNEEIILMIREYQNLSSKHQAESNRLVISLADLIFAIHINTVATTYTSVIITINQSVIVGIYYLLVYYN